MSGGHGNVYTDGACSKNGKRGARVGAGVYCGEGDPDNVITPVQGISNILT